MEQISGVVESITFQNAESGYAVIQILDANGDEVTVVGPLAGATPGEELTLAGRFVEHPQYGPQFEAVSCVYRMPEEEGAVLKYLSSGVLPGIGPATARRIVQAFGGESLEILANQPDKLADVRGLSRSKAMEASARYREIYGLREAMSSLSALGLTAAEAVALYRKYENRTMGFIKQNPYILCAAPLHASFARADAIAERLGHERDSAERTDAAILYTLRHNLNNGHTCLPLKKLLDTSASYFAIEPERIELQWRRLVDSGQLAFVEPGGGWAYLPELLRAEMGAAQRIRAMAAREYPFSGSLDTQIALLEQTSGIQYAPQQKEAIKMAMTSGVMVITGGPGTGKTTTINAVISLLERQAVRVGLAAPTGRAAKRMSELTGRKASTLHRMLEAGYSPGSDSTAFARNAENPLRHEVLIIDEVSMVDALLFESLLDALRPGARLILVGDADQLPSVGAGNVLKGILTSGAVPVTALTQIFRQAAQSLIVSNAHRIVRGQPPEKGGRQDDFFVLRSAVADCQNLVGDLVARRLVEGYGYSPIADIQVLCPGRKGPLGTEALNRMLQQLLNPAAEAKPEMARHGVTFRLGDKVMQVKNNYDLPFTRTDGEPGAGAFNGDIGLIEEINPKTGSVTVLCEDRHTYYTQDNLHELEHAYAVTIHKSQGSEFEAVVILLGETPKPLRYRNLLYTAVTRAKSLCIVAGDENILLEMVHNDRRNLRFSCFAQFLGDEELL